MKNETAIVYALIIIAVGFMTLNQVMIYNISGAAAQKVTQVSTASTQASAQTQNDALARAAAEITPKGIPAVYGSELGVSYDSPVQSMNVLAALDGDLYKNGLLNLTNLTVSEKTRYVNIGMSIACEYCCGAKTLVVADGRPACGCAHSAAMRGLAKYLLINHPDMTDQQILNELVKWKILFFPGPMTEKYLQQIGGSAATTGSSGSQLPSMVGGC